MAGLSQRLVAAAWDGGTMHCDGPEVIVARVLRELANSPTWTQAQVSHLLRLAARVEVPE